MEKGTQRDKVLSWLKRNGSLTVRDAVTELNVMSVPKRIEELRKMGYPITLEWKQTETGSRYGVYRLTEVN
jgi:predicted ArsR family transcriptional regulator